MAISFLPLFSKGDKGRFPNLPLLKGGLLRQKNLCNVLLSFQSSVVLLLVALLTLTAWPLFAHQGGELRTSREVAEPYLSQAYRVVMPQTTGGLSGVVKTLEGALVREALVYLKGVHEGKDFFIKEPLVLDQREGVFMPHVLVVPLGGTVELRNSDSEMHNLHSFSAKNASFNEGIAEGGPSLLKKFDLVEVVRLGCDIHKEMRAWIIVRDNPYYALTDEGGRFNITEVPPGTYQLSLWHEDLDKAEQSGLTIKITIEPDTTLEVDFYLTPKK